MNQIESRIKICCCVYIFVLFMFSVFAFDFLTEDKPKECKAELGGESIQKSACQLATPCLTAWVRSLGLQDGRRKQTSKYHLLTFTYVPWLKEGCTHMSSQTHTVIHKCLKTNPTENCLTVSCHQHMPSAVQVRVNSASCFTLTRVDTVLEVQWEAMLKDLQTNWHDQTVCPWHNGENR